MSTSQGAVYFPEDLAILGQARDRAVQSLPPNMRTRVKRAEIARIILACAATGERDPIKLELTALMNARVTVAA
jgi:hypothetical protein